MRIVSVLTVVGMCSFVSCAYLNESLRITDPGTPPAANQSPSDTGGTRDAPTARKPADSAEQLVSAEPDLKEGHPLPPGCSGFRLAGDWIAEEGSDLETTLRVWAKSVDWTVTSRTSYRWPIEASHHFSGDLGKAVAALLEGFVSASPAPAARAHCANQVLVLGDRG